MGVKLIIVLVIFVVCSAQIDPGLTPDKPNANVDGDFTDPTTVPTTEPTTPAPTVGPVDNITEPITTQPVTIPTIPTEPPNTLGQEESTPGKSCNDIYLNNEATRGISGNYWVYSLDDGKAIQVVCNMELQCDGSTGGWLEVVNFDVTNDNTPCPGSWSRVNDIGCISPSIGCIPAVFKTHGIEYHKVCGFIKGYQKGATDGFQPAYNYPSINSPYVDGVSITTQSYPSRKHIWTYASGLMDEGTTTQGSYWNCPCAANPGMQPPPFVFDHYYCESGATSSFDRSTYYTSDPLWDGDGCGESSNCCTRPGAPWFYRSFPAPMTHNIETRICRDQNTLNENIAIAEIALYVK